MEPANDNGTADADARALGREQRELMCKLTEAELLQRGETMAEAELEIAKLKEERKGINGTIADLSATRNKLAKVIEDGEELRAVDCTWIEDIKQNVHNLIRQDTGELVTSRAMTAADHQLGLGLDADGAADGGGDADADAPYDEDTGEVLAPPEMVDVGHQNIGTLPAPTKRKPKATRTAIKGKAAKRSSSNGKPKHANGKARTRHVHA